MRIIINVWYNYHVYNKRLLEECGKEENLKVTGAATTPYLKEYRKTFCPMSRIHPVTARQASKW